MDRWSLFRPLLSFPHPRLYPLYGLLCLVLVCSTEKSVKKEKDVVQGKKFPFGVPPLDTESEHGNLTTDEMQATMNGVGAGCYRKTDVPLEVLFLIDRTSKKVMRFGDTIGTLAKDLSEKFDGSRFGVSFFADFSCGDLFLEDQCSRLVEDGKAHLETEGCYTSKIGLSEDAKSITSSIHSMQLLNDEDDKAGLAAILLAATDENVGWTSADGPKKEINRVIFLVTDSGTNCCKKPYGTKNPPKGDGQDSCLTMNNPTPEFVREVLRKREISLFVGLLKGTPEPAEESWQNVTSGVKVASGVFKLDEDDHDQFVDTFKDFMVKATFMLGPVGCMKDKKPTMAAHKALIPNAPFPQKIEVDIYFLVDRTSAMVRSMLPKLMKIIDRVKTEYPGSRFGMGYYADFVCSDWETEEECKERGNRGQELTDTKACYTFGAKLSTNPNKVKSLSHSIEILPRRGPESGIAALLLTATDDNIGWTVDPDRNRIIFVITDDGTSCCEKPFGTKKPPKGDGSDKCHSMDNPTPEFTGARLRDREISVFLALAKGGSAGTFDTFSNWKEMAGRMHVPFEWANIIQDKASTIYRKLRAWIITVMYKYSYGGTMLQPGTLEMGKVLNGKGFKSKSSLDVLFLIDRSSKTVLKMVPNMLAIMTNIKKDYPGSRYGMSFFSDFICTDWYSKEDCEEKVAEGKKHMEPEGCYTFNSTFSLNRKQLATTAKAIEHLPGSGNQAGVAAVLLATMDRKLQWSGASDPSKYKIIFVVTDEGTHCCKKDFGTKKAPKGDGMDKCDSMENPTPEMTGKVLNEEKTSLFLLLSNGDSDTDTFQNWMEMVGRMKVEYGVANMIQDDNPIIYQKFKEFIRFLMKQRGETPKKKKPKGGFDDYAPGGNPYGGTWPCPTQVLMAVPFACCPSLPGTNCTNPPKKKTTTTEPPDELAADEVSTPPPVSDEVASEERTREPPPEEEDETTTVDYSDEIAPEERTRAPPPEEEEEETTTEPPSEEVETTTEPPSEEVETTTEPPSEEVETTTEPPPEEEETTTEPPSEEEEMTTLDYSDYIAPEERTRVPPPEEEEEETTTEPPSEEIETTTEPPSEEVETTTPDNSDEIAPEERSKEPTTTPKVSKTTTKKRKRTCILYKSEEVVNEDDEESDTETESPVTEDYSDDSFEVVPALHAESEELSSAEKEAPRPDMKKWKRTFDFVKPSDDATEGSTTEEGAMEETTPEAGEEPQQAPLQAGTKSSPCEIPSACGMPVGNCCPDAPSICPPLPMIAVPLAFPGLPYGCPWYNNNSQFIQALQQKRPQTKDGKRPTAKGVKRPPTKGVKRPPTKGVKRPPTKGVKRPPTKGTKRPPKSKRPPKNKVTPQKNKRPGVKKMVPITATLIRTTKRPRMPRPKTRRSVDDK